MNGFLNFYKPSGMSSAYALNKIKHLLPKGETLGHMGTLDPLACGILPVAIGKSTRLFNYLLDKKKTYIAVFEFGYETDTLDKEGKIVFKTNYIPDENIIRNKISSFIGEIMQIPPVYSAKSIGGERSYALARKGVAEELPPKKVTVLNMELLEKISCSEYKFLIECKGGTYIRSISRDLGRNCNSFATMTALERTRSGIFNKENSITLEQLSACSDIEKLLIPPEKTVDFPEIRLSAEETETVYNGKDFYITYPDGIYRVFTPTEFYGIGEIQSGKLKVKAYLKV